MVTWRRIFWRKALTWLADILVFAGALSVFTWIPLFDFSAVDRVSSISLICGVLATIGGLFVGIFYLTSQMAAHGLRAYSVESLYRSPTYPKHRWPFALCRCSPTVIERDFRWSCPASLGSHDSGAAAGHLAGPTRLARVAVC